MARTRKSGKKDRMTFSFTEFDEDVFDYLDNHRNASALVRFLVRNHMNGVVTTAPSSLKVEPEVRVTEKQLVETSKEQVVDKYVEDYAEDCTEDYAGNDDIKEYVSTGFNKKKKIKPNNENEIGVDIEIKERKSGSKKIEITPKKEVAKEYDSESVELIKELDLDL